MSPKISHPATFWFESLRADFDWQCLDQANEDNRILTPYVVSIMQ
jgi:hypothetical protein